MLSQIEAAIKKFFEWFNDFLAKLDILADWDKIFGDLKPEE